MGAISRDNPRRNQRPKPYKEKQERKNTHTKKNPKVEGKQKKLQQTPQTFDGN
jgi:hypothetical protein